MIQERERVSSRLGPSVGVLVAAILLLVPAAPAKAAYELVDKWDIPLSPYWADGGIAVDTNDDLYLSFFRFEPPDGATRIVKFDSDGGTLAEWRGPESPYEAPTGIATDSDDHVYLARSYFYPGPLLGSVVKLDSTLSNPTPFGYSAGDVGGLGSLAVDSNDNLYMSVLDAGTDCRWSCSAYATSVHKFDAQGNFETTFAEGASGWEYRALATDPADGLYVVSGSGDGVPGSRIDKYTAAGKLIGSWDSSDDGGDLDTDSRGKVFVASPSNRILIYDSSGTPLGQFGSEGSGPGQFNQPTGIAIDSEDDVHVLDGGNDRILKYTEILPQTTFASGPQGPTNDKTPSFGFSSDAEGSSFQCRARSNADFLPCANPYTPKPLNDGDYTLEVRAKDSTGSIDESPASRSFTVDTKLKGRAFAQPTQRSGGPGVKVRVGVRANEKLTSKAKGKVKLNRTYRLRPKVAKLAKNDRLTLKLRPKKRKHAKQIAAALQADKQLTAKLKVRLIDEAGNRKIERLGVVLER